MKKQTKEKIRGLYKVVTEGAENELWANGFYDKDKAQKDIDEGYFHQYMYKEDKHKKLIVVEY
jgi:hypothetical protein